MADYSRYLAASPWVWSKGVLWRPVAISIGRELQKRYEAPAELPEALAALLSRLDEKDRYKIAG